MIEIAKKTESGNCFSWNDGKWNIIKVNSLLELNLTKKQTIELADKKELSFNEFTGTRASSYSYIHRYKIM